MKPLSRWNYLMAMLLWLSLSFALSAIVMAQDIRGVKDDLIQFGDAFADHLNRKMVGTETILKGFSAMFGAVGNTDPAQASSYVRQVIANNPEIFALEIVQKVDKRNLHDFIARKRHEGSPDFAVRSFSYGTERKWVPLQDKCCYYPIVFMEPMTEKSSKVIGLDVGSVPFLSRAMFDSLRHQAPVSTHPFRLVEGNTAYVVFYPIQDAGTHHVPNVAYPARHDELVDMVIDAESMARSDKFPVAAGWSTVVYHRDFSPDDPKGRLFASSGQPRSALENAIFPSFTYRKELGTMGEPFSLMVKRQVGWADLNWRLLGLVGFLTLISSLTLLLLLRSIQRSRISQIEHQHRLWQLANFDSLTGLPNRMHLLDRLEQELFRINRQEFHAAVMFLDIDDFKLINDSYGHAMGDLLLQDVSRRLRGCVRETDTVARLSGDEFVVILGDLDPDEAGAAAQASAVGEKILAALAEPYSLNDPQHGGGGDPVLLRITSSIGVAVITNQEDAPEQALKHADSAMYLAKRSGGNSIRFHGQPAQVFAHEE
jgi:diguanylate cyclase (GGDEF)-like protein